MIRIPALIVLLAAPLLAVAQGVNTQLGSITPFGSYDSHSIDTVSLDSGSTTLSIPLQSFRQRGGGSINIGLKYHGKIWSQTAVTIDDQGDQQYFWEPVGLGGFDPSDNVLYGGVVLASDLYYTASTTPLVTFEQPVEGGPPIPLSTLLPSIAAPDEDYHPLLSNKSDNSGENIATDGSRFTAAPNFWGGGGKMTSPDGTEHWDSNYVASGGVVWRDRNGNAVTVSAVGQTSMFSANNVVAQDTVGRSIQVPMSLPLAGNPTTDFTGCSGPRQTSTAREIMWPGDSGPEVYKLCFTDLSVKTNFANALVTDYSGVVRMLQSVVMPNRTTWTFEYDDRDPGDDSTINYGDLTRISLPTGGSISYTWSGAPVLCSTQVPVVGQSRTLVSRTEAGIAGSQPNTWTYAYQYTAPGSTAATLVTTATGPLPQNDRTITTFTDSAQVAYEDCRYLMTSEVTVDGTSGKTVKAINRSFPGDYLPVGYAVQGDDGVSVDFSSWLPLRTTVTIDGAATSKSEGTYDGGTSLYIPENYQNLTFATYTLPYGSTITEKQYEFGSGVSGPLLRETDHSYDWQQDANYIAAGLLDFPSGDITKDGQGHQVAQTSYGYDEPNGSPQGALGNLTSTTGWLNNGTSPKSQTVFNSQGMPASTLDAQNNQTSYNYDTTGLFVITVQHPTTINGVQHIDHYTWNQNIGKMTSHIDQNNVETKYFYNDPLGRLTLVDSAVGALGFANLPAESKTLYSYPPSGTEMDVAQDQDATGDGVLKSSTFYDGFGRTTRAVGRDGSVVETAYDGLGRVCAVSNPTFNDPGPLSCVVGQNIPTAATDGYTYFSYDALGRKTRQTQPDGNTLQWSYNGNVVDFYDEDGSHWQRTSDALGRLTKVLENDPAGSGALTLETDYTYDPLNNLTSVNQKGASGDTARYRTFLYDSLSRLTYACNPEAIATGSSCTPSSGPWSAIYSYDANSNVITRTDARGVVTHYAHDALNRLITKTYTNDPANTPALSYTYDQEYPWQLVTNENHPVGHLNSIQAAVGTTNVATWASGDYDQRGNLTGYYTCLGSNVQSCPTASGVSALALYDLNDSLVEISAFSGSPTSYQAFGFNYQFDNAGRLTLIQTDIGLNYSSDGTVAVSDAFTGPTFYPGGAVKTANLASNPGFALFRTYDNRGRITGESDTDTNQQNVYSYSVSHDGNGNVTGFSDSVSGAWTVTNDPLHRLLNMSGTVGGVVYTAQETYDHFGNRNVEVVTAGSDQMQPSNYLHFSAGNNRADEGVYDNAGNPFSDGANNYLYDAENRICAVQQIATGGGGSIIGYLYAPNGTRLGKNVNLTSFSCDMTQNGMLTANGVALTAGYDSGLHGEQLAVTDGQFNMQQYNIMWEDRLLGTFQGTTYAQSDWHFALNDWVGTKRVVTNSDGSFSSSFFSGPFGDFQTQSGSGSDPSDHHFTGKERDIESGLDYFPARYYNSYVGRWMSPDWSAKEEPVPYAKLDNPQSLNLYSYALNNPLSNADTDGHACGGLYVNGGSGFCTRATEYGRIDAISGVQSQTRFFAAANAVSQALGDLATPISGLFVSGKTSNFLESVGQNLEKLNLTEAAAIQNGSLRGPNLDQQLVHNEQSSVQGQLDSLQQSDPTGYTKAIGDINGSLNSMVTEGLEQLSGTDRAYAGVLAGVRTDLGRNIDFSNQSDREAIGNALIKHIRQTGGCDVNGSKQAGCQ